MTKPKTIYYAKSTNSYYTKAGTKICQEDVFKRSKAGKELYKVSKKSFDKKSEINPKSKPAKPPAPPKPPSRHNALAPASNISAEVSVALNLPNPIYRPKGSELKINPFTEMYMLMPKYFDRLYKSVEGQQYLSLIYGPKYNDMLRSHQKLSQLKGNGRTGGSSANHGYAMGPIVYPATYIPPLKQRRGGAIF